jgi:hypothetical protein
MTGDNPRNEAGKRGEPEIAPAEWLFRDDPAEKTARPAGPVPPGARPDVGEGFELADSPFTEPEAEAEAPPTAAVTAKDRSPARPREAARTQTARAGESFPIEAEAAVDTVWSRGAEWGPNLLVVAAWLFALAMIVYFLMGWETYWLAFLVLLVGIVGAAVLSYPILITLERPVRITPEQAVRDFYGALSHHVPHYRRMWLLLARTGRITSSYGSFEGFKAYWKEKLQTIKGSRAGSLTPLVFEVENFRGDKSAGKSRVEVTLTLKISIRGQRQAGPIASIPGQMSLVRGPDKMWYLESGTLPHARTRSSED